MTIENREPGIARVDGVDLAKLMGTLTAMKSLIARCNSPHAMLCEMIDGSIAEIKSWHDNGVSPFVVQIEAFIAERNRNDQKN
jgi:hypothetical protein